MTNGELAFISSNPFATKVDFFFAAHLFFSKIVREFASVFQHVIVFGFLQIILAARSRCIR